MTYSMTPTWWGISQEPSKITCNRKDSTTSACGVMGALPNTKASYHSSLHLSHILSGYFRLKAWESPCDAWGGVVKVACDEDVKNGTIIQSADDMFKHLSQHNCLLEEEPLPTDYCHTLCSFRLVEGVQCTLPSSALSTVPGTRRYTTSKALEMVSWRHATSNMACFCDSCLQIKEGNCMSSHVVQDWVATRVSFTKAWRDDRANQHQQPVSCLLSPCLVWGPCTCPSCSSSPWACLQENIFWPAPEWNGSCYSLCRRAQDCCEDCWGCQELPCGSSAGLARHCNPPRIHWCRIPVSHPPPDAPPCHFSVWVLGDGNCLPRTLSILAIGHSENFRKCAWEL